MKGLVSAIALAAMIAFSSTGASANVPTGYEVKGSTFYTLVNKPRRSDDRRPRLVVEHLHRLPPGDRWPRRRRQR